MTTADCRVGRDPSDWAAHELPAQPVILPLQGLSSAGCQAVVGVAHAWCIPTRSPPWHDTPMSRLGTHARAWPSSTEASKATPSPPCPALSAYDLHSVTFPDLRGHLSLVGDFARNPPLYLTNAKRYSWLALLANFIPGGGCTLPSGPWRDPLKGHCCPRASASCCGEWRGPADQPTCTQPKCCTTVLENLKREIVPHIS